MTTLFIIWLLLLVVLAGAIIRRPGTGGALSLSYFVLLSVIHVPGALPYMGNTVVGDGFDATFDGFELTVLGLAALVAGHLALGWFSGARRGSELAAGMDVEWICKTAWRFAVAGFVVFGLLLPLVSAVNSLTSVVSGLIGLLVLAAWMEFYGAAAAGDLRRVSLTVLALPVLPALTLTFGGFLGYGVQWAVTSLCALVPILRRRWIAMAVLAPVLAYLGLSLFIGYAGQRDAIRETVWYEQAGFVERVERISAIFTNFEVLDLSNDEHATALDRRLNQNLLVGATISRVENGEVDLAYGGTVPWWVLVPRALWPDKPEVGGGGNVAADFTGFSFAEGTSVGAGQVLEFYANFGRAGVIGGFFLLGLLLAWLDRRIFEAIAACDLRRLMLSGLPGLTLMQPGGNLLEVIVSAVAAILAAHLYLLVEDKLNPGVRHVHGRATDRSAGSYS